MIRLRNRRWWSVLGLNTATAAQLDALPGIGPAYAPRIPDYRERHEHDPRTDLLS